MKLKGKVKSIIYWVVLVITFLLIMVGYIFKYNNPVVTEENTLKKSVGVVNGDCTISQKFEVKVESLNSVDITYVDFNKDFTNGTMLVEIFNDEEEAIYRELYNIKELKEYDYMIFVFDPIDNVKGKIFELRITMNDTDIEKNFTFYAADESSYEIEQVDDDNLELYGTIDIIQHGVSKGYFYMFVFYVIFLIEILFGSYKYIKPKEISTKKMIFGSIISILISCLMAVSLIGVFYNVANHEKIGCIWFPILLVTSSIEMIVIGATIANHKGNISKLFLSLAIPLGALYCICMVPGSVPDERYHAVMTYELATGQFLQKDVTYLEELEIEYFSYEDAFKALNDKTKTESKFEKNGGYWLLMYVGGAIGMAIGKLCGLSVLGFMYTGSFVNYLLFLIIGYIVIEKLPFGKYTALVYMLSPIYIQQVTSLSCDALINAAAMLFVALILNYKFREEKIKTLDMVLILSLGGYLSFCKQAYFPMLILLFLIKDKIVEYAKKHKKSVIIILSCIIVFLVASRVIMMAVTNSNNLDNSIIELDRPQKEINKLQYLMKNPIINIPYLIFNTLYNYMDSYIIQFSGNSLNWFRINGPVFLVIIFYTILFASTFFNSEKYKFSKTDKRAIISCWLINTCIIFAGIYIGWWRLNYLLVGGVQGRYFIPTTLILLLLMGTSKNKLNVKNKNLFITIPLLFINIYMLALVIQFYL